MARVAQKKRLSSAKYESPEVIRRRVRRMLSDIENGKKTEVEIPAKTVKVSEFVRLKSRERAIAAKVIRATRTAKNARAARAVRVAIAESRMEAEGGALDKTSVVAGSTQILSAMVGGAVLGSLFTPIVGAVVGGAIGAIGTLVGRNSIARVRK